MDAIREKPRVERWGGWKSVGLRLGGAWHALKLLYLFLVPLRFSLLAVAAVSFAFLWSKQGADMLRALVEYDPCRETGPHVWRLLAFVAAANAFALQVWYWGRQILRVKPPQRVRDDEYFAYPPPPERFPGLVRWLPRLLGIAAYAICITAFLSIGESYSDDAPVGVTWMLIWLVASLLAFVGFVILRRHLLTAKKSNLEHREPKDFDRVTKRLLVLTCLAQVGFFVWATFDPASIAPLGSGSLVLFTAALWVPIGTALVMVGIRTRFPILSALLVWALLWSPVADWNHVIRTVELGAGSLPDRPDAVAGLRQWYVRAAALHPAGEIPIFVVATEGGGIRAAYWTAAVLTAVQDAYPSFRHHLFAISAVSGGALGAGVFDALLVHGPAPLDSDERACRGKDAETMRREHETLRYAAKRVLSADFLTPTLAGLTQPDLAQRFLPFGFPDRQEALEEAWERGWSSAMDDDDLFARGIVATLQANPSLPALFLNGTMVETGDRIVTSNYRIHPGQGTCVGDDPMTPGEPLCQFRNAFDGFAHLDSDIPFSSGGGMSARFTYVSPAGRLPRQGRDEPGGEQLAGHVVDGGYFENSGAVTAAEIVSMIQRAAARHSLARLHPYVIVIDFGDDSKLCKRRPDRCRPHQPEQPFAPAPDARGPAPRQVDTWVNELLSPVRALLNTRDARGSQAVGDIRELLPAVAGVEPDVIEFRLIQRKTSLPLGWVLSEQSRIEIDGAIEREGGNRWALREIGRRLGRGDRQPPKDWVAQSAAASAAALAQENQ